MVVISEEEYEKLKNTKRQRAPDCNACVSTEKKTGNVTSVKNRNTKVKNAKLRKRTKKEEQRLLAIKQDVAKKIRNQLAGGNVKNNDLFSTPPLKKTISIVSYFKPEYQSLISAILSNLKQIGVKITDRQELQMPYGDVVHGSNVVQLMKELVTGSSMSSTRPRGWKEFLPLVAKTDTPLAMFSKKHVRTRVMQIRQDLPWEEY
jgi:hypothetical protein